MLGCGVGLAGREGCGGKEDEGDGEHCVKSARESNWTKDLRLILREREREELTRLKKRKSYGVGDARTFSTAGLAVAPEDKSRLA